jgi:hypothetical protein
MDTPKIIHSIQGWLGDQRTCGEMLTARVDVSGLYIFANVGGCGLTYLSSCWNLDRGNGAQLRLTASAGGEWDAPRWFSLWNTN